MQIFQVIGVGLLGVIISSLLKKDKPEFTLLVLLASGVMILVILLSSLTEVINAFATLVHQAGLDNELFAGVLKIIGIGYLTEYAASMCTDCGAGSIATKIQLGGKITIFLMGLPIIQALVNTIAQLL